MIDAIPCANRCPAARVRTWRRDDHTPRCDLDRRIPWNFPIPGGWEDRRLQSLPGTHVAGARPVAVLFGLDPMSTIQAVIWDFGGVISASPFAAFARFEREYGLPAGFLRGLNATDPDRNAWARLERNDCSLAEFDALFEAESRAAGYPVRGTEVLALLDGAIRPEMVEALKCLRERLRIGLITNNFLDAREPVDGGAKAGILRLFHHVIESARAGLRKPDPRIYRMMVEALDVDPMRCVYLDDLGINLKPARELGMRTIKVGDPMLALAELESIVGFALRA
jgi:putative hydrolase of the HAD superfamily